MTLEDLNKKCFDFDECIKIYSKKGLYYQEKRIVHDHFNKDSKMLDVGCGTGRTTVELYNKGFDVEGIDISPKMIKEAKKLYPKIKFKLMDATNLRYDNDSFDIVLFSFNGLDYIYPSIKRIKVIKDIFNILKDTGLFVYSSHNTRFRKRPGYYKIKHSFGTLNTYFNNIFSEINNVRKLNFNFIEIVSSKTWNKKGKVFISLFDKSPYYVFRKENFYHNNCPRCGDEVTKKEYEIIENNGIPCSNCCNGLVKY